MSAKTVCSVLPITVSKQTHSILAPRRFSLRPFIVQYGEWFVSAHGNEEEAVAAMKERISKEALLGKRLSELVGFFEDFWKREDLTYSEVMDLIGQAKQQLYYRHGCVPEKRLA